jgi:hypothetical protein
LIPFTDFITNAIYGYHKGLRKCLLATPRNEVCHEVGTRAEADDQVLSGGKTTAISSNLRDTLLKSLANRCIGHVLIKDDCHY